MFSIIIFTIGIIISGLVEGIVRAIHTEYRENGPPFIFFAIGIVLSILCYWCMIYIILIFGLGFVMILIGNKIGCFLNQYRIVRR